MRATMRKLNQQQKINPLVTTTTLLSTLILAACAQDAKIDKITELQSPSPINIVTLESEMPAEKKTKEHSGNQQEYDVVSRIRSEQSHLAAKSLSGHQKMVQSVARMSSPQMGLASVQSDNYLQQYESNVNRDKFESISENRVKKVVSEPVSTFSIDVDTGAYSVVRSHLNRGVLPPAAAVRIEEMVNYFDYQYPQPKTIDAPFSISTEIAKTPWNENTRLLQVGLQGYLDQDKTRTPANLVFLLDVSGSMNAADKLPLLKSAFRMLVKQLNKQDKISIVVYAGSSGVVLEPTAGDKKGAILSALDKLSAGGSTHGSAGIKLAYSMAEQSFIKGGINRVILATDGDFNVGTVNHEALVNLVEKNKSKGISLTTLGFGHGNYNDALMEQLADHGDGNYAYIDNLSEARKTLVQQIAATLETIAKDVKIQIEWNPQLVSEYRLVGYQNRILNREDFNNDKVDAGEIGAGHTVTALYEITMTNNQTTRIDPLRYQVQKTKNMNSSSTGSSELAFLKLRYKKTDETKSRLIQQAITQHDMNENPQHVSNSLQFAASVAAFGDLLRGGVNVNQFDYEGVLNLARKGRGEDLHGYRGEFIRLVELSAELDSNS